MKDYIGTKLIKARPATNFEAKAIIDGTTEAFQRATGLQVGTKEADGYLVEYPDNYRSWSPKEVFEDAYRECDHMTFGLAIEAMKKGCKVARSGWNGKGMFLYYVPAAAYPPCTTIAREAFRGEDVPYGAYIAMKTAQGNVVPWLASQTDMLSEDWHIVE